MFERRKELDPAKVVTQYFRNGAGQPVEPTLTEVLQIDQFLLHYKSDNEAINS